MAAVTIEMVLDPKSGGSHNDYGSISAEGEVTGEGGPSVGGGGAVAMTQSDLYQRQPLLDTSGWVSGTTHIDSHQPPDYDEDDEDKMDGLKRNAINSNGVVRIEVPSPLREEPRFPQEKMKTFIAFLMLAMNLVLSTISLALVHERVPDRSYPPLPDTFLDNVPSVPWLLDISEVLIMVSTNVTVLVILLHKHRYIVFRRVFLILALLYMMRSITMFVTVLPMSSTTYICSPKVNHTSVLIVAKRVFQLISGMGLSINGKHTYCGDYIYSGHTIILIMCYLIIYEYSPKRLWPLHWASFTTSIVGVVLVLVARGHYTVDVIIAYWVTTRVFWIYHTLANHALLKNSTSNNLLARAWWFGLFRYFEGNVGGPLPRLHEWPLPWPRRFLAKHPNRDTFLILAMNLVLSTISLALVHERVPDRSYPPLPDTFLDNVPSVPWLLDISEVLIMVSTNVTVIVILLHKHRYIVFRRVFLILALLYMMRSITMFVTVLPMSSTTYVCSPKVNHTSVLIEAKRVFQLISGMGLSINGKHTYCGDYIYSGHTIILIMCYLIIYEYSPKRMWPLHWASFTTSVVEVVLVLVARGHYTVDVIIAYWVTTRVFWIYHTLANHALLKNSTSNNLLARAWWFGLFRYFEGNVGGPLPRLHEWPLPWPRHFLAKHPNRDS